MAEISPVKRNPSRPSNVIDVNVSDMPSSAVASPLTVPRQSFHYHSDIYHSHTVCYLLKKAQYVRIHTQNKRVGLVSYPSSVLKWLAGLAQQGVLFICTASTEGLDRNGLRLAG